MRKYFVIMVLLVLPFISFSQEPLTVAEEMPEYPGGDAAMLQFISSNIVYPIEAKEKNIAGMVYVSFVIDTTGKTTNVKIVRGANPLLDAEAVRVISSFPLWKPGKQKGKFVYVKFVVPINFTVY